MHRGFIKEYRCVLDSGLISHHKAWALRSYLRLNAVFKPVKHATKNGVLSLQEGQVVVGRKKLAVALGLSEQEIRSAMKLLKKTGEISTNATRQYTIVTICNWGEWQSNEENKTKTGGQFKPREEQTGNQRTTTEEECLRKRKKNAQEEAGGRVLDSLNERLGTEFTMEQEGVRSVVLGILGEGYTPDEMIAVFETKFSEWNDRPEMCGYLRPSTLFGSKFVEYLQAVNAKKNHKCALERWAADKEIKEENDENEV